MHDDVDIPVFRVFYWFGHYYSLSLLVQAVIMIGVQIVLLKVALDNRPSPGAKNSVEHVPFSNLDEKGFARPYEFWQWKSAKPYWMFLAYFVGALSFVQILLPPIARSDFYVNLLGYAGLAVEAILPLPQIVANHQTRSCKGFRVSVLAAWILGDVMKMSYFFCSKEVIPWAFRICGMFQCVCDLYLGLQFWMYARHTLRAAGGPRHNTASWPAEEKDIRMT
ncbi:PQ-loop repeat-containing protein [Aspergillus fischeri NRRL 181]|uniref:PQ loop repeat protein n=1 Tax=Neosartorya fischeri (strain ATCC 1020 / DSM 3700 / CBS 544.65 / FGSC A1164 / JCM 1740 / NRRL 181 / WB 181) TaxID=331117 RepID=A1CZW6_NEOFI|nr:PQ loop repeat protein [Aspergillus fischeri NRRL 181]EAW24286.1 PQ loop repeat protein [Aspergillus fischeri NRRL 181]